MKDKKAEQRAKKEAHKSRLREAKNRRIAPDFQVPPPTREERQWTSYFPGRYQVGTKKVLLNDFRVG